VDFIMDNLGTIIVIAVLVAVMMNVIGALGPLMVGRTRTYIEKATDAHEAVYRKRKMSARLNMSGIRPRRVVMSGPTLAGCTASSRPIRSATYSSAAPASARSDGTPFPRR
jgi:hypothetical protein